MIFLLIADLHLTALLRDAYRWRLFPWLLEACITRNVQYLVILGDLTEAKDYHSAKLVNQIVDALCKLFRGSRLKGIIIVPGNHDGIDPNCPYFRFLGQFPFIKYIPTPFMEPFAERNVLFLPHTKEPERWDRGMLYDADFIFMHQTFSGAQSETGVALEGLQASVLNSARKAEIWSGDVHVPQVVGRVKYVGSPYPVRFGDSFKPRAVLLEKDLKKATDLEPPAFRRLSLLISSPAELQKVVVSEGDQVKVRVRMTRAQFVDWEKTKRAVVGWCKEGGIELCGLEVERVEEAAPKIKPRSSSVALSPAQVLDAWAAKQNLAKPLLEEGHRILATVAPKDTAR